MADLRLGEHPYVTTTERDATAALRSAYRAAGRAHRDAFMLAFDHCKSLDELFEIYPKEVARAMSDTTLAVANDVAAHRIYHLDESTLRAELETRVDEDRSDLDEVRGRYLSIINVAAAFDAERSEARENRPSVIGGGFGIEGAAQGMAIATAANAALGAAYGLANLTAKAASNMGDRKKKREVFEDPRTRKALGDFLIRIRLHGATLTADSVNAASERPVFEVIDAEEERRAAGLVRNVIAGRVPPEDRERVLQESLELNPFAEEAWVIWLEQLGDPDGSLGHAAAHFGVDAVASRKDEILAESRSRLPWSTPEQCLTSCNELEQVATRLGVPFGSERQAIEERAQEMDRYRRSFRGNVYETVEKAEAAREEAEAARRMQDDLQRRTFDGTTYSTAADADAARAASKPKPTLWQKLWWNPHAGAPTSR